MSDMDVKYPHPNSEKWAVWNWSDIPSEMDPKKAYLRRLRVVQTPWFGVYIHWINESDSDRHPHDHPWDFYSFVLCGWYAECVYDSVGSEPTPLIHFAGTGHSMSTDKAHQITDVADSLTTLIFTGRRKRVWCFWTDEGKVPWRTYLRRQRPDIKLDI